MLPWKLRKRQILPVNQNLSSVYFSLAKFQLVSCNLSLAMIWQMTYTHKLPKLCSATLKYLLAFQIPILNIKKTTRFSWTLFQKSKVNDTKQRFSSMIFSYLSSVFIIVF